MPIRKEQFAAGECYHIYNRGQNKQSIFRAESDYNRFIEICLKLKNDIPDVHVLAWAFLPNHFHFLVRVREETPESGGGSGGISRFFYLLQMSYARYCSCKYERSGPLFQGRFCSKHVDTDAYLLQLLHYIHRQPTHHKIMPKDDEWPYTSLHDYLYLQPRAGKITEIDDSILSFDLKDYPALFASFREELDEEFFSNSNSGVDTTPESTPFNRPVMLSS